MVPVPVNSPFFPLTTGPSHSSNVFRWVPLLPVQSQPWCLFSYCVRDRHSTSTRPTSSLRSISRYFRVPMAHKVISTSFEPLGPFPVGWGGPRHPLSPLLPPPQIDFGTTSSPQSPYTWSPHSSESSTTVPLQTVSTDTGIVLTSYVVWVYVWSRDTYVNPSVRFRPSS